MEYMYINARREKYADVPHGASWDQRGSRSLQVGDILIVSVLTQRSTQCVDAHHVGHGSIGVVFRSQKSIVIIYSSITNTTKGEVC